MKSRRRRKTKERWIDERQKRQCDKMIFDAHLFPSGETIQTDLCIVGAGAAGIALALTFEKSNLNVLLLESGNFKFDTSAQSLYEGDVADASLHCPPIRYRQRRFGGSTAIWGGRCVPLDPIDMEERAWLGCSGWPLLYDEIARYYPAATALCEAGDAIYSANHAISGGMKPLIRGFEPKAISTEGIERFSRPTNFGRCYRDRLQEARNIKVILNANCTEIVPTSSGMSVESLVVRTLSGIQFHVRPRIVALAMGGLEIPRLLLASRRAHPQGIGNTNDLVGRYYMCHLSGTVGKLKFNVPRNFVSHGYERTKDGIYCRRRIALLPETQRQLGIGNVIMRLHHPRLPDATHRTGILSAIYLAKPFISYEYSKRLHGTDAGHNAAYFSHILNVAREPVGTVTFLLNWLRRHTFASRKLPSIIIASRSNFYSVDVHAEQRPNPESRITLTGRADQLGMPRIFVDWRHSRSDIDTVSKSLLVFKEEIDKWGGGTFEFEQDEVESCMLRDGAYGGHNIGTTKMAMQHDQGVVDPNCRVHGISNLYIASSAVFPTSGQANPTLTIVALAIRLGEHLQRLFERPENPMQQESAV
jgi:GMC oxidoreductase